MKIETLERVDGEISVVRIRAEILKSKKEDLCIVRIMFDGLVEPANFFVDIDLVESDVPLVTGKYVKGAVQAVLHGEEMEGQVPVMIPGDAVSYGPYMWIPTELVV